MSTGPLDKKNNVLPTWGNEKTMNLNNMILTNILSSHYFKVNLYQLKTFHEVVDEIYYNVTHLEPWEKGSRKTSGQTGMCGGVRGVGAGGIVSTAFCILYKLFTLRLTRKQVIGLITHCDSPYIRGLGFMYIRYTQPPADLWDWYETYLTDEEEIDVKAGGGQVMTIGEMLRHFLCKLEWHATLFPRTPVPIQKDIERKLSAFMPTLKAGAKQNAVPDGDANNLTTPAEGAGEEEPNREEDWTQPEVKDSREDAARASRKEGSGNGQWSRDRQDPSEQKDRERHHHHSKRGSSPQSRTQNRSRDRERDREQERTRETREKDKGHEKERNRGDKIQDRDRSRTDRDRSRNRERDHRNSDSRHHDRHRRDRSSSRHKSSASDLKHKSHSREQNKHRRH